jgi:aryl carrier-like protein
MTQDLFDLNKPSSHDLARIQRLTERAVMLQKAIDVLEGDLKTYSTELLELRRELIPDAMAEHNLSEFKLTDGSGVKIGNFVSGSLPKTPLERTFALALLEEHGGEALIQNELIVNFQKKDHNRATALAEELRSAGYEVNLEGNVHHSTLAAWCREKVRAGERLDFEKLGMFVGRDTKVILPGDDS